MTAPAELDKDTTREFVRNSDGMRKQRNDAPAELNKDTTRNFVRNSGDLRKQRNDARLLDKDTAREFVRNSNGVNANRFAAVCQKNRPLKEVGSFLMRF